MAAIEKRKNSYRIVVSCGYDVYGKQVKQAKTWKPPESMTARQAEKEVQRQAMLFEQECLKGQVVSAVKFQTLAEEWFSTYAKQNLRLSTYEGYQKYEKRIYSAIGHLRLDRITTRDIQHFINSLSQDGENERTGKGLAPKTIRNYNGFISGIFSYAIKLGMVTDNPCSRVTLPKKNQTEKKIYTNEQTEKFLRLLQAEPLKYRLFFTALTYSGLRKGELLGDKWEDYNRLFVQWNGKPMCPHTPYNWLRDFCEKIGLPCYGVHHYRHLFASLAIGEGVDIVTLSGALGHTNPNVTLGTYSHLLQNAQEKVANAIENALDFSKPQAQAI